MKSRARTLLSDESESYESESESEESESESESDSDESESDESDSSSDESDSSWSWSWESGSGSGSSELGSSSSSDALLATYDWHCREIEAKISCITDNSHKCYNDTQVSNIVFNYLADHFYAFYQVI